MVNFIDFTLGKLPTFFKGNQEFTFRNLSWVKNNET